MAVESVLVSMIRRGGLRKSIRAITYVAAWATARAELGHDPSWSEYGEFWRQSQSTTAREVRAFTSCVPEGVKVADVWAACERYATAKEREQLVGQIASAPWVLS